MATLVLTTVGSLVGGPIGGAIGAALGQQVDRTWLSPAGTREGPRLKQLEVQTSSYGTAIPAIFGAMRVAGTVIWATDLIERGHRQGGGKGRSSTVEYSYSVSLAVALSSRPIARIGRIWADGNLLRGAEGDLKVETHFRFHDGHDDQPLDPLLASSEAAGQCPAHRGLAYVVFEDLQLANFGNRIPQLTFEIFEREEVVSLIDIAGTIARVSGQCDAAIDGYALVGENGRVALAPLVETMPVLLRADGDALELIDWPGDEDAQAILPLASNSSHVLEPSQNILNPNQDVPASLSLRHYDPARDYQLGVQRSDRGGEWHAEKQIDLPASLSAEAARNLAETRLLHAQRARQGWTGHVPITGRRLRPGDWLMQPSGRKWRVDMIEHGRGSLRIEASGALTSLPEIAASAPGRAVSAPDIAIGKTKIALADLPAIASDPEKPQLAIFAAGSAPGWRRAALSIRQGTDLVDIGATAVPAIIGHVESAIDSHSPFLVDERNRVIVALAHEGMALPVGTGSPLDIGSPSCLIGREYLRYGLAEALDGNRYRLSRLLRGCSGSEDAAIAHVAGESFLLLEAASAKMIEAEMIHQGQVLHIEAMGAGDEEPVTASINPIARAITPLSPVHFAARALSDGGIRLDWHWRSRVDFGWQDGIEQPCPEIMPLFEIRLFNESGTLALWEVAGTEFEVPAASLSALEATAGEFVQFEIRQIGRFARSVPVAVSLQLPASI